MTAAPTPEAGPGEALVELSNRLRINQTQALLKMVVDARENYDRAGTTANYNAFKDLYDQLHDALSASAAPGVGDALTFADLRETNLVRCARWHKGGVQDWSLSDWAVATAGELGEAMNVVKKLNRERDGLVGNDKSVTELRSMLADEIADTAIYLDLMAAHEGIDLDFAIISKYNRTSEKNGFPDRLPPERATQPAPGVACVPEGWIVGSLSQDDHKLWWCELREGYRTSYNRVVITETGSPTLSEALQRAIELTAALAPQRSKP